MCVVLSSAGDGSRRFPLAVCSIGALIFYSRVIPFTRTRTAKLGNNRVRNCHVCHSLVTIFILWCFATLFLLTTARAMKSCVLLFERFARNDVAEQVALLSFDSDNIDNFEIVECRWMTESFATIVCDSVHNCLALLPFESERIEKCAILKYTIENRPAQQQLWTNFRSHRRCNCQHTKNSRNSSETQRATRTAKMSGQAECVLLVLTLLVMPSIVLAQSIQFNSESQLKRRC